MIAVHIFAEDVDAMDGVVAVRIMQDTCVKDVATEKVILVLGHESGDALVA